MRVTVLHRRCREVLIAVLLLTGASTALCVYADEAPQNPKATKPEAPKPDVKPPEPVPWAEAEARVKTAERLYKRSRATNAEIVDALQPAGDVYHNLLVPAALAAGADEATLKAHRVEIAHVAKLQVRLDKRVGRLMFKALALVKTKGKSPQNVREPVAVAAAGIVGSWAARWKHPRSVREASTNLRAHLVGLLKAKHIASPGVPAGMLRSAGRARRPGARWTGLSTSTCTGTTTSVASAS